MGGFYQTQLARRWGRLAKPFPVCSPDGMGSKRLDSISDYHRHGFDLRVTCLGCGRVVVIDSLKLSMACSKAHRSRQMPAIQARLACRECGGREVKCGPVGRR